MMKGWQTFSSRVTICLTALYTDTPQNEKIISKHSTLLQNVASFHKWTCYILSSCKRMWLQWPTFSILLPYCNQLLISTGTDSGPTFNVSWKVMNQIKIFISPCSTVNSVVWYCVQYIVSKQFKMSKHCYFFPQSFDDVSQPFTSRVTFIHSKLKESLKELQ